MNSSSLYHKHPIKGGRDDQRWQDIPKDSLDKLLLRLIRHSRLRARELILERPFAMESTIFSHHFSSQAKPSQATQLTEYRMSIIHALLSLGNLATSTDMSSIRFCMADRGVAPANPCRIPRIMACPCRCTRAVFASSSASFEAVRTTREFYL